jgi:hypothetical protein
MNIKPSVADPDPGSGTQIYKPLDPGTGFQDRKKQDPGLTSATLVKTIEDEGVCEHQGKSS